VIWQANASNLLRFRAITFPAIRFRPDRSRERVTLTSACTQLINQNGFVKPNFPPAADCRCCTAWHFTVRFFLTMLSQGQIKFIDKGKTV
jgi:hypothetical protein